MGLEMSWTQAKPSVQAAATGEGNGEGGDLGSREGECWASLTPAQPRLTPARSPFPLG